MSQSPNTISYSLSRQFLIAIALACAVSATIALIGTAAADDIEDALQTITAAASLVEEPEEPQFPPEIQSLIDEYTASSARYIADDPSAVFTLQKAADTLFARGWCNDRSGEQWYRCELQDWYRSKPAH